MKITKGDVTVEVDDVEQVAKILRLLSDDGSKTTKHREADCLTPNQRAAYTALAAHENGAHYTLIAEELGVDAGVMNGRLNSLMHNQHLVLRTSAGTFKVVS